MALVPCDGSVHGCSLLSVAFVTNAFLLYLTTESATKSPFNYALKMASKLFNEIHSHVHEVNGVITFIPKWFYNYLASRHAAAFKRKIQVSS